MLNVDKRIEVVGVVEVTNGNINGDPDNAGVPRQDAESSLGLCSGVKIKRLIRDAAKIINPDIDLFVEPGQFLNDKIKKTKGKLEENFFDVRAFGAVASTGDNKKSADGKIQGPFQVPMFNSIDQVDAKNHSISRCCHTDKEERNKKQEANTGTFGQMNTIPYGVYVFRMHYTPYFAQRTGFSEEDMKLFLQAAVLAFDLNRSHMAGEIVLRKLYVMQYPDAIGGKIPCQKLFEAITVKKKDGVDLMSSWDDVEISDNLDQFEDINTYELVEKDREVLFS